HGAYPSATAPERLVDFWLRLQAFCREYSPGDAETTAFKALTPSLSGLSAGGDGLQEEASVSIGMRLPPGIDPEFILAQVPVLMPDAIFHFQPGEPCVRGGKSNALVAAMVRGIRSEGGAPRFKVKTGTSDMNVVGPVWKCPMLAYGPGDSHLDHTPDEHLPIEEYLQSIRVLTAMLEDLE
ncbi:MAG: M20/M25/M40 family metallo-hydrolase, partial [Chloroflexota bacterium]